MTDASPASRHFAVDQWKIIEDCFRPENYRRAEGVLALANGYMGQRASFEEGCSGVESLCGNYIAGVFDSYPNPTMIKLKGRPANPNKMVNAPDHLPVEISVNGERLDIAACQVENYRRTLHLDRGLLTREMTVRMPSGLRLRAEFMRMLSMTDRHIAATRIAVTPLEQDAEIEFASLVNAGVANVSTRHLIDARLLREGGFHGASCRTAATGIRIAVLAGETLAAAADDGIVRPHAAAIEQDQEHAVSRSRLAIKCAAGQTAVLEKLAAVATSRDNDLPDDDPAGACVRLLAAAQAAGIGALKQRQEEAWRSIWQDNEIAICQESGGHDLTQGLRYALFQMIQSAPRTDPTVNIGAKGLTGEHYFGTYFWDTEVFMLPMYAFAMPEVAENLERSRVHMLPGARRKAAELDLPGAAFPFMADTDGNECSTLWQFALMGIHVTADVAWGVWFYYCVTGDLDFIAEGGIDIMVETSRMWVGRAFYSQEVGEYVINKVLGPDEYHQGVDNNYYTNIMAQENLAKTCRLLEILQTQQPDAYRRACERLDLPPDEQKLFRHISESIYLPVDEERGICLQDDGFDLLEPYDLQAHPLPGPVNAAWSYDRAMRTQVLRQADVLVAGLLVGDRFPTDQIQRDFDYYEPRTTHDSSLSFCTHSIMAAAIRRPDTAYDYFLRTARLDLDDFHDNSWMGIHAACLGGAWQCVVLGFGGVRWYDGNLSLNPLLPPQWTGFSFSIRWHGVRLHVEITPGQVALQTDGPELSLRLADKVVTVAGAARTFAFETGA